MQRALAMSHSVGDCRHAEIASLIGHRIARADRSTARGALMSTLVVGSVFALLAQGDRMYPHAGTRQTLIGARAEASLIIGVKNHASFEAVQADRCSPVWFGHESRRRALVRCHGRGGMQRACQASVRFQARLALGDDGFRRERNRVLPRVVAASTPEGHLAIVCPFLEPQDHRGAGHGS